MCAGTGCTSRTVARRLEPRSRSRVQSCSFGASAATGSVVKGPRAGAGRESVPLACTLCVCTGTWTAAPVTSALQDLSEFRGFCRSVKAAKLCAFRGVLFLQAPASLMSYCFCSAGLCVCTFCCCCGRVGYSDSWCFSDLLRVVQLLADFHSARV